MTAQKLIDLLEPLGFTIKRPNGSHTILKNPQYDSIVVVPTGGAKELNRSIFLAIKKNVVEKGIISEREFNHAVETIKHADEIPVTSKTANVVEEITVGREVNERAEIVRDTIRNTDADVNDIYSNDSTERSSYRNPHRY